MHRRVKALVMSLLLLCKSSSDDILCISVRDVTDSESASESGSFSEIRNPTDT